VRPEDEEFRGQESDRVERKVELEMTGGARLHFVGAWDAQSIEPWLRAVKVAS
jgi:hypothetical protein